MFCGTGLLFHLTKTYKTYMVLVSGKAALGNFSDLQEVVGQAITQALQHPVSHLTCARLGGKNVKPAELVERRTCPVGRFQLQ